MLSSYPYGKVSTEIKVPSNWELHHNCLQKKKKKKEQTIGNWAIDVRKELKKKKNRMLLAYYSEKSQCVNLMVVLTKCEITLIFHRNMFLSEARDPYCICKILCIEMHDWVIR